MMHSCKITGSNIHNKHNTFTSFLVLWAPSHFPVYWKHNCKHNCCFFFIIKLFLWEYYSVNVINVEFLILEKQKCVSINPYSLKQSCKCHLNFNSYRMFWRAKAQEMYSLTVAGGMFHGWAAGVILRDTRWSHWWLYFWLAGKQHLDSADTRRGGGRKPAGWAASDRCSPVDNVRGEEGRW